ncbi:MAG TPA: purine-nucleoside phosphorylase [Longimicrobiales bacterium]|nr:purine-nucleoside phosphorylase [Longimicrobiales bacterium]
MTGSPEELVRAAVERLSGELRTRPRLLVILGSGLGGIADAVEVEASIPYGEIPGFGISGVTGHAGRLLGGRLEGVDALVMAGRVHLYEGHPPAVIAHPIRTARALGADTLFVTNAAGGISPELEPGSLMLIEDHINLMAANPLVGPVYGDEERFPDMSRAYDRELTDLFADRAADQGVPVARGVYCGVLGPSFETPAEVRMLGRMGADAVGMSTVPEVLAARSAGMRVVGVSLITNRAAGLSATPLGHDEVFDVARVAGGKLERVTRAFVRALGET